MRILAALDTVGARHSAKQAEVALAWVMAQTGITAPIASATTLDQVDSLVRAASLKLSAEDLAALDKASA
jgi:aryl-alcohol dehydrogenase-like predicted oxidoreductase